MKKLLLSFLGLLSFEMGYGQITVNQIDLADPGDVIIDDVVNLQGSVPGSGSNQNYNFLTATSTGTQDTSNYVLPSATPFGPAMQGSNLASVSGNSFTFYEKDASGFYLRGTVFDLIDFPFDFGSRFVPLRFSQRLPILTFPATNGMNLKAQATTRFKVKFDTTISLGFFTVVVDSFRVTGTITDTSIIDGFGQAQFATGNVDCLRNTNTIKIKFAGEIRTTTLGWISSDAFFAIPDQNFNQVLFWANGKKAPIVTIQLDNSDNVLSTFFQAGLLTMNRSLLSAQPDFIFTPYPNPASKVLNLNSEKTLKSLKIFSLQGKKIDESDLEFGQNSINISDLGNGIYWMEAESQEGLVSRKKLIINK